MRNHWWRHSQHSDVDAISHSFLLRWVLNFYFKDKRDSKHRAFPFMGLAFGDKSRNSFLGLRSQRVSHIYSLLSFSFYIPSWVNFYLRGETEAGVHFPVYIGSTLQSHLLKTVLFCRVVSRPLPEITWAHLWDPLPILSYWSTDLLKSPHLFIAVVV